MPERWERDLRRLRSAVPSDDLWERAARGPARPDLPPGPGRRTRAVAIVVSVAVVAAAGYGTYRTFRPIEHHHATLPSPAATGGYFLTLPDQSELTPSQDADGGVQLSLATNLPDGTSAFVRLEVAPQPGDVALTTKPTVQDGVLSMDLPLSACDQGDGFTLTVEVRPFYEDFVAPGPIPSTGASSWPPTQPDGVLAILGDHFQNLTGDQVTTVGSSRGDINQIVVTGQYSWPTPQPPLPCPSSAPTDVPSISPSP